MAVLDRLVGLESEYAIRFHADPGQDERPANFAIYRALVAELRRRLPVAEADLGKDGVFLANGSALCFERVRPRRDTGLVESATPECRGPRPVIAAQRALDELLAEVAQDARVDGQVFLGKSDRDAAGNVYGAQENYELELASGFRLALWRLGLVLLSPGVLWYWCSVVLLVVAVIVYYAAAATVAAFVFAFSSEERRRPRMIALLGHDLINGEDTGEVLPAWLEPPTMLAMRLSILPLALGIWVLAQGTAFVRVRRQLVPFLLSRGVVAGAGRLDDIGAFHVASKATGLNCVLGVGGVLWDRPIFSLGHFCKTLMGFCGAEYRRLYARRQRLQIGLGDSLMSEEAEYLRVGTTMLVLDMIEAGGLRGAPRFLRPMRALHRLMRDPSLETRVRSLGGREWTALALQRFYWSACFDWLQTQRDVPDEARDILRRWDDVLTRLEDDRESLFGRVDWITKRELLDRAGTDLSAVERKKIDIRYHELGPDGYFHRLSPTGLTPTFLSPDEIERARRTPPADTPAHTRCRYIREFSEGDTPLRVRWNSVTIGRGKSAKTIPLPQSKP